MNWLFINYYVLLRGEYSNKQQLISLKLVTNIIKFLRPIMTRKT